MKFQHVIFLVFFGFTIQIKMWKKYCVIYLLENKVL